MLSQSTIRRIASQPGLSIPVKYTLLILCGLAGSDPGCAPQPFRLAEVQAATGLGRATFYAHASILKASRVLVRTSGGAAGGAAYQLAAWLFEPDEPAGARPGIQTGLKEEEEFQLIPAAENPILLVKKVRAAGGPKPQKAARRLPEPLERALLEAGLFRRLLGEVAASHYSDEDLLALLAWCCQQQPRDPAALFITRLRYGAVAAAPYYNYAYADLQPCPACGAVLSHDPDCRRRYQA